MSIGIPTPSDTPAKQAQTNNHFWVNIRLDGMHT